MKFRDLMKCKDIIILYNIKEYGPLQLELTFGFIDSPKSEPTIRKIVFESYVTFEVIAEHYEIVDEKEIFSGERCRIYSKSNYLNYVKATTYAEDIHPETPLVHYQFVCEDHTINVISLEEEPQVVS